MRCPTTTRATKFAWSSTSRRGIACAETAPLSLPRSASVSLAQVSLSWLGASETLALRKVLHALPALVSCRDHLFIGLCAAPGLPQLHGARRRLLRARSRVRRGNAAAI